jgi:hypothetical protein
MMLKNLRVKILKILKTVKCPVHTECGMLVSLLATSYNVLRSVYIPMDVVEEVCTVLAVCPYLA